MLDQPPPRDDLFVRSEIARYESLQIDLELLETLVDRAATEYQVGDRSEFHLARTKAELAYTSIRRLMSLLEDPAHRGKIRMGLNRLRATLDMLAAHRD